MLHHHDLRVVEVPVQMHARGGGASSITSGKSAYYMIKVLLALFVGMFRRRPVPERGRRRAGPRADGDLMIAAPDRRHGRGGAAAAGDPRVRAPPPAARALRAAVAGDRRRARRSRRLAGPADDALRRGRHRGADERAVRRRALLPARAGARPVGRGVAAERPVEGPGAARRRSSSSACTSSSRRPQRRADVRPRRGDGRRSRYVLVAYNSAERFATSLPALARSWRAGDEVIVVDNASADDSDAVVARALPAARA